MIFREFSVRGIAEWTILRGRKLELWEDRIVGGFIADPEVDCVVCLPEVYNGFLNKLEYLRIKKAV